MPTSISWSPGQKEPCIVHSNSTGSAGGAGVTGGVVGGAGVVGAGDVGAGVVGAGAAQAITIITRARQTLPSKISIFFLVISILLSKF